MKRFRLSTLMLLIVIAALVVALVMERNRSARLEQQLPKYHGYKSVLKSKAKAAGKAGGGIHRADFVTSGPKEEDVK